MTHNPFDESPLGELLEEKLHEQFLWGGDGNEPKLFGTAPVHYPTDLAKSPKILLPWIRCKNLTSRILPLISERLPDDSMIGRLAMPIGPCCSKPYEKPRFAGTCYKAANWQNLGDTKGRRKLDTLHRKDQPTKSIWIYPLTPKLQRQLRNG